MILNDGVPIDKGSGDKNDENLPVNGCKLYQRKFLSVLICSKSMFVANMTVFTRKQLLALVSFFV